MTVLVDTTIWSFALRRRPVVLAPAEVVLVEEWMRLVRSGEAALAGPIRQEVLSGIKSDAVFSAIQERLADFRHLSIAPADYDVAARFFNSCRGRGIAASAIDMLLCAVAHRCDAAVFTTDADFTHYSRCLGVRLHRPGD